MQPYFRDAVRGDLAAISALLWAGPSGGPSDGRPDVRSAVGKEGQRTVTRELLAEIDRTDGNYLLVAEYDRRLAAVVQMIAYRDLALGGARRAELVTLRTAPEFATTGIAGLLIDHAVARAVDLGCWEVVTMIDGGRSNEASFWERSGFVHLERGYVRRLERANTPARGLRRGA